MFELDIERPPLSCPHHGADAGCAWNGIVGWMHPPELVVDVEIAERMAAAMALSAASHLAKLMEGRTPRHRGHEKKNEWPEWSEGCFACALEHLRDTVDQAEKKARERRKAEGKSY